MKKTQAPKPPEGRSIVSTDVKKREKRIRAIGWAILIIFELAIFALMFTSCTQDDFLKDDCAIYDLGTVIVRNSSGIDLIVDVTFNEATENAPIALHCLENAVNLTIFHEIPQGSAVVWWRYDQEDWQHAFVDVESCQEVLFVIQEP